MPSKYINTVNFFISLHVSPKFINLDVNYNLNQILFSKPKKWEVILLEFVLIGCENEK
jgi:hypothetical protein